MGNKLASTKLQIEFSKAKDSLLLMRANNPFHKFSRIPGSFR